MAKHDTPKPIDAAGYDKIVLSSEHIAVGRKIVEDMQLELQTHNYAYGDYLKKLLEEDDSFRDVLALVGYAASASTIEFTLDGMSRLSEQDIPSKILPLVDSCEILGKLNAQSYARRVINVLVGAID